MPDLGDRFRAERETRGLSLSEVAEHLRIRSVYLAAIESEDWKAIGAPVYIRGFLRTYARFLGLDPEAAVVEYNALAADAPRAGDEPTASGGTAEGQREGAEGDGRMSRVVVWGLSLVAVAMVAFVVYNEVAMRAHPAGPLTVAVVTGAPAAQPTSTPPPLREPAAQTLELRLDGPSWLSVTVDGNASIVGTFPAGTSHTFHGKNATIRVGNAGAVQVLVNGKNIGKLGASGAVVERTFAL